MAATIGRVTHTVYSVVSTIDAFRAPPFTLRNYRGTTDTALDTAAGRKDADRMSKDRAGIVQLLR